MSRSLIESSNPTIDVDDLINRARGELTRARSPRTRLEEPQVLNLRSSITFSTIEALVNIAEQKSQVRTKWPGHLRVFPFSHSGKIRALTLSLLAFLFKDQRHVNEAFVQAFREVVTLNKNLIEQVALLRQQIDEFQLGRLPDSNEHIED